MLKEDFLKIYQKGVEPVRNIHMSNSNDVVVSDRFGNLFVWNEGLVIIYKCPKPSELSPDMLAHIKTCLFSDELPEFNKFNSLSNEQKDELGVPSLWYGLLWEDNYLDDYVVSRVSKRVYYYKEVDWDNGFFPIYKEGDFTDDGYEVTIQEQEVK